MNPILPIIAALIINATPRQQVRIYAHIYGVDPALCECIVAAESDWNAGAVGALGEEGLFQILPTTWLFLRDKMDLPANASAFDASENIRTGIYGLARWPRWWMTWPRCVANQ